MNTRTLLIRGWDIDPSVVVGCALLILLYFWKVQPSRARAGSFVGGIAVLLLALESPLDALSDTYLFSAHMAQHLLLILIVPPLLLLGLNGSNVKGLLEISVVRRAERVLGRPSVAWWSCILVMTLWHIPALYNFALEHEGIHIFQHLTFLVTGTMFWWPVLCPLREKRMEVMPAIFYLFAAAAENTLVGIVITFMPVGYYPAYLHPVDELGALSLVRDTWGISVQADQRLGGLFMWVPGCSIYFVAILLELAVWFSVRDEDPVDLQLGSIDGRGEGAR